MRKNRFLSKNDMRSRRGRRDYSMPMGMGMRRMYDYEGDSGNYERGRDYADMRGGRDYDDYGRGRDYADYNYDMRGGRDYNYDMRDYAEGGEKYDEDLHKWCEKLKKKDRFNVPKEQILKQAHNMGIKFEDFTEEEFYTVYLMMLNDYPSIANDYNMYIKLSKDFLEDDDIEVSPSEKLYIHFYYIVKGKEIKE